LQACDDAADGAARHTPVPTRGAVGTGQVLTRLRLARYSALDELEERAFDLRRHLLRQVNQPHQRSTGGYCVRMQAATIRRGQCPPLAAAIGDIMGSAYGDGLV
jgi:hypothetical protein